MKNLLRTLTLALAVAIVSTFYFANPFTQTVRAAGCWLGCTDGPQRNRSGCSVRFREYAGDGELGLYEYTCGNATVTCTYQYNCSGGGGEIGLDEPPQN